MTSPLKISANIKILGHLPIWPKYQFSGSVVSHSLQLIWELSDSLFPHATEQLSPQLLSLRALEPMLHNKRSHHSKKPVYHNYSAAPIRHKSRKPAPSNEDPAQTKTNKYFFNK